MASLTLAATFSGSGAYESELVIFCPSVTTQFNRSDRVLPLLESFDCWGMSSQVKLEMGYASLPGAFVIETRKSAGIFGAEAAAAVTPSNDALTNAPVRFLTLP